MPNELNRFLSAGREWGAVKPILGGIPAALTEGLHGHRSTQEEKAQRIDRVRDVHGAVIVGVHRILASWS